MTNYYFEIDEPDELRKKGVSKEHRPKPDDMVVGFGMHQLIVVADKVMMSGDNIARNRMLHNGYVISYSVRGADQKFKDYVLDEKGYTEFHTVMVSLFMCRSSLTL